MNLREFKSKLQFGGARPNLFRVLLSFPSSVTNGNEVEEASFMCKAAQIPPAARGTIEIPFMGRVFKVAGDTTFEEWPITILNDNDFLIRDAFERWVNAITAHEENTGLVQPGDYMVDMTVEQLNRQQEVIKSYTFVDAWPSDIEAIDLSYENTDTIEEFGVTIQYALWTSNTTT